MKKSITSTIRLEPSQRLSPSQTPPFEKNPFLFKLRRKLQTLYRNINRPKRAKDFYMLFQFDDFLSPEDCEWILSHAASGAFKPRRYRPTYFRYFNHEKFQVVTNRLQKLIDTVNRNFWKFDIYHAAPPLVGTHYRLTAYESGDHYPWHTDFWGGINKITASIQLLDPSQFKGGKIEVALDKKEWELVALKKSGLPRNGKGLRTINETKSEGPENENSIIQLSPPRGSLLLFPTWCAHRVTPVTEGRRYSLLFPTRGNAWR